MKTKHWVALVGALLVLCLAATWWLFGKQEPAGQAQVYVDGGLVMTLDLSVDQTVTVTGCGGSNTITVCQGSLAVTWADCPDGDCMDRGWCDGGADLVCLPHRLVIHFMGSPLDQVTG